jgi:hypothetical protein
MSMMLDNPDVRLSTFLVRNGHLGVQQASDLLAD